MKDKELWLLNTTNSDVSLSDIGVKVPAKKTVNVFAYNPYVTEEQVSKSTETGSINKRVQSGVLKIVSTAQTPPVLGKILESKTPILAKKTKSSVVVESDSNDIGEESKSFEFADYGLGGLESELEKQQGMVSVKQKQDSTPEKETSDVETTAKTDVNNLSKQSSVIMDLQQKNLINPIGKMAETSTNQNQVFVVTKPPIDSDADKPKDVQVTPPKVLKAGDTIMVVEQQTRNIQAVTTEQKSQADDTAIKMEKPTIDAKVATKTQDGAIIMEMKEVPQDIKPLKPKKSKKQKTE